jgi:peptidoglycan/LPS O-acetylase OafA/YrhL
MFYTRRFLRIVPLYVAVLLGVQALIFASRFFPVEGSGWVVGNAAPWYSFWTFTQNFFMARANTPGPHISSVTWSLAVEEQFYLTLPLVIRFVSGRRLLIVVVAGIILAPILRTAILLVSPGSWVAPFVLMPCRMDALLLGVLAAILFRSEKVWERFQRSGRYFALLFVVLLCGVAFLMLRSAMMYDLLMQKIGYTWMAFFYATLLVFVLSHRQSFLSGIFRNATLRWLGMLAYCTYLIHQAVQGAVFAAIWHRQPGITDVYTLLTMIACLAATLGIANLSWRYFERPLIGLGHGTEYRDEGTQVSRIG